MAVDVYIQDDSWLVDITAADDFLVFTIKKNSELEHMLIRNFFSHKDLESMKGASPSWESWGHTAPGQHGHSAQTPEEKNLWASLSDSVKAERVLMQVLV